MLCVPETAPRLSTFADFTPSMIFLQIFGSLDGCHGQSNGPRSKYGNMTSSCFATMLTCAASVSPGNHMCLSAWLDRFATTLCSAEARTWRSTDASASVRSSGQCSANADSASSGSPADAGWYKSVSTLSLGHAFARACASDAASMSNDVGVGHGTHGLDAARGSRRGGADVIDPRGPEGAGTAEDGLDAVTDSGQ